MVVCVRLASAQDRHTDARSVVCLCSHGKSWRAAANSLAETIGAPRISIIMKGDEVGQRPEFIERDPLNALNIVQGLVEIQPRGG